MRLITTTSGILTLALLLALAWQPATAQFKVDAYVIGGGGGSSVGENCSRLLRGTAGMPAGGLSTSASLHVEAGFWQLISGTESSLAAGGSTAIDYAVVTGAVQTIIRPLDNDLGAGLSLAAVENPAHGSIVVNGDIVTYTPNAGFFGVDIFRYTAQSSSLCTTVGTIAIAVEEVTASDITTEYVEREKNRQDGVRGLRRARCITISPDGRHLYVAGQSDHSIAIFARDPSSGVLSFVKRMQNGRNGISNMQLPAAVAISADGLHVYVAGYRNNALLVFRRNPNSGGLTFVEFKKQGQNDGGKIIDGLKRIISLSVSPDGRTVYAAGFASSALAVFERTATTGSLRYLEVHKDGQSGVDGLRGAYGVTVSPDGENVYVTGSRDNAVAVFQRNVFTGLLSFEEQRRDGIDGVDGLRGAASVEVSPDGAHVYVTGRSDNAVAVFGRNSSSGSLTYVERLRDGGSIDGLRGAADVAVSHDGKQVYVAGGGENAIAVFGRNDATGTLRFLETRRDGVEGVDGLRNVQCVVVGPMSETFYCAGRTDDAVSVFSRNRSPRALDDIGLMVNPSSVLAIDVLANDSDGDGDPLTISGKTDGALGTVAITGGGSGLSYTAGVATGQDQFSYTISDGRGGSSTATVEVHVGGVYKQQIQPISDERGESVITDSDDTANIFSLSVAPNPFYDEARITFTLRETANLRLRVLDLRGQTLATLFNGPAAAKHHSFRWNGRTTTGEVLAAGMFIIEILSSGSQSPPQRLMREIVLLR